MTVVSTYDRNRLVIEDYTAPTWQEAIAEMNARLAQNLDEGYRLVMFTWAETDQLTTVGGVARTVKAKTLRAWFK